MSDVCEGLLGPGTGAAARSPARDWRVAAWWRRSLFAALALMQTATGVWAMQGVLPYHGATPVEFGLLVIDAVLFGWISAGMWLAVAGFLTRLAGGDRYSLLARHRNGLEGAPLAPTAVIMPIYHEDVARAFAGLRATYRSLARTGQLEHFEFFILSDSRDPEYWLAEQEAWFGLREELGAHGRLHYRRRRVNLKAKTGNVADFLRRWGRRFRYFVVLDADSLMEGETLVTLVRLMEREPRCGILQTAPSLVNARSPFARLQQFANHVYGPVFTAGLAALQLGEAAYWGHNAIIRIQPFMRYCSLRALRGLGLFRGPVLSHDFVEAALMARAGYEVWLEPELAGSYEESPPTLDDELARDRRWARGNLQHLRFLFGTRGLRLAHRMAFVNGIVSYLSAPLWLAALILSAGEAARFALWPIDYFPQAHSLFPLWPQWRPEWSVALTAATVLVLLLPKALGLLDAVRSSHRRRACGDWRRLAAGVILESLVSVLLAPVRMLAHSRHVAGALLALPVTWAGQNRSAELGWAAAWRRHAPGAVLALAWSVFSWRLGAGAFAWSLPLVLPMLFAAPLSVLLARFALGERLRRAGLWTIPQETGAGHAPLLSDLAAASAREADGGMSAFERAVLLPCHHTLALAMARPDRGPRRRRNERLRARCLAKGPQALSSAERALLADSRESLAWLHAAAWQAAVHTPWGRRVEWLRVERGADRAGGAPRPQPFAAGSVCR